MIRPSRPEALRYGDRSQLGDSIWDHPFQWGSKRTGPDLARVGPKYPASWHYFHMRDPRQTSPGSNMPPYAFLTDSTVDLGGTDDKMRVMQKLGVPYSDAQIASAAADGRAQAQLIVDDMALSGITVRPDSELVALTAYLQSLGRQLPPPNDAVPPEAAGGAQPLAQGGP
jgi:cytochrome c oxidase cbb3-type subunit I/II